MSYYTSVITHITQDGDSALILAAKYGYTEMVVELVKAKANLDLQNKVCSRLTATIHCACTVFILDDVCHTAHVCHHTGWILCTDGSSLLG